MSLFDILKYQNTDLSNANELSSLPNEILESYIDKTNINIDLSDWLLTDKIEFIATVYSMSKNGKCTILGVQVTADLKQCFADALKEYSP